MLDSANIVTFSNILIVKVTYVIPSVRSGSQGFSSGAWHVPNQIGGQQVIVIDTAADITIISGEVYKTLMPRPEIIRDTNV